MGAEGNSPLARAAALWRAFLALPGVRPTLEATLRLGAVGLALFLLFAASAVLSTRLALVGREVTVPDLNGLDPDAAGAVLAPSHLTLQVESERYDVRVEAGKILAQDPPAGAQIKRDRKVKVITSLGSQVISIPDLRGAASRKAQITLRQENLKLGNLSYVHSPEAHESQVIAQEPRPETDRVRDDRVNLLVSQGPAEPVYVMPDLVGIESVKAQDYLQKQGFRAANVVPQPGEDPAASTVLRQSPPAGHPVHKRDVVTLVVGKD